MKTAVAAKVTVPVSKGKAKRSVAAGVSNPSSTSSVKRSGKTKVRAVPDFSKLHQKWENKLEQGKACAKKPCTTVEAFDLTRNGGKIRPAQSRVLNDEDEENQPPVVTFKADPKALRSIASGKGLGRVNQTGRATIASTRALRTSSISGVRKVTESKPKTPVNLPVKDVSEKSPDFETLAEIQKVNGLDFQSDDSALKSILDNKGIEGEVVSAKPPQASRQTMSSAMFKTPTAPPQKSRITTDVRRSIYYTDQKPGFSRQNFYTEYTQRTVSRLTLDCNAKPPAVNSPKPEQSPAHQRSRIKVVPQRGSIYCKVQFSKNAEPQQDAKTPQNLPKAVRILSAQKKATNSPAVREMKQTPNANSRSATKKWRDVLKESAKSTDSTPKETAQRDSIVTKLTFADEVASPEEEKKLKDEEEKKKLEELQALEKRLEEDIARENASTDNENQSPSVSTPNMPPVTHANRVVFGALSANEIARRSSPSFNPRYDPKSPVKVAPISPAGHKSRSPRALHRSPRLKGCGSPRFQRALSPLVRDSSRDRIRPCRKFAIAKDVLDASIDIITVPATESDASILAPREKSLNSSMQSPLKDLSPNVLHGDRRKSLSGGMKSPAGKTLEQQVLRIASVLDQENSSPLKLLLDKENLTPKSSLKLDKILDKENLYPDSPTSKYSAKDISPLNSPLGKLALASRENMPVSPMCKLSLKDKLDSSSSSPSLSGSDQENDSPSSPLATRLDLASSPLNQKVHLSESPLPKPARSKISSGTSPRPSPRRKLGLGSEVPLPCSPGGTKRRLSSPKEADEAKKPERRVKFEDQSKLEDMNTEQLNMTLSESLAKFDSLSDEMSSLQSQCQDPKDMDNTNNLLKKLEMINQRQEQLRQMQLKLQAQLEKQASGKSASESKPTAESPKKALTPARYDSTQNYGDFIAANVVDISPLTSASPPRLPLPGVLSGADGYSPFLQQKQAFFPKVNNESGELVVSPHTSVHDQVVPLTKSEQSVKHQVLAPASPAPSSPVVYSPKPVMCGSAQLLGPAGDFTSPVPINTPLALRNMAIPGSACTGSVSNQDTSIWDISCTPEDSPVSKQQPIPATPPSAKSKYSSGSSVDKTPERRSGQVLSSSIPTNTLTFCNSNTPLIAAHTAHTVTSISSTLSPAYSTHITPAKITSSSQSIFHSHITPQKLSTSTVDSYGGLLSSPKTPKTPGLSHSVNSLSLDSPIRSPMPASPGTLSLAAHLPTRTSTTPGISIRSMALSNAMSRFYDALLDDEVALYACRMGGTSPAKLLPRIQDPVASTLMHGDEMHFIPVTQDDQQVPSPMRSSFSLSAMSSPFGL